MTSVTQMSFQTKTVGPPALLFRNDRLTGPFSGPNPFSPITIALTGAARRRQRSVSLPCGPRIPWFPSVPSRSAQQTPNFPKFTFPNPLIYRVLTLSNLNRKNSSRASAPKNQHNQHNKPRPISTISTPLFASANVDVWGHTFEAGLGSLISRLFQHDQHNISPPSLCKHLKINRSFFCPSKCNAQQRSPSGLATLSLPILLIATARKALLLNTRIAPQNSECYAHTLTLLTVC